MRRRRPEKRTILPDPTYKDYTVAKFINYLMKNGKKSIAEKIFYNCLDIISEKEKNENAIDIFKKALTNVACLRSQVKAYRWCYISSSYGSISGKKTITCYEMDFKFFKI